MVNKTFNKKSFIIFLSTWILTLVGGTLLITLPIREVIKTNYFALGCIVCGILVLISSGFLLSYVVKGVEEMDDEDEEKPEEKTEEKLEQKEPENTEEVKEEIESGK